MNEILHVPVRENKKNAPTTLSSLLKHLLKQRQILADEFASDGVDVS